MNKKFCIATIHRKLFGYCAEFDSSYNSYNDALTELLWRRKLGDIKTGYIIREKRQP